MSAAIPLTIHPEPEPPRGVCLHWPCRQRLSKRRSIAVLHERRDHATTHAHMRGNTGGGVPGRRIVRRFACGHLRTWDRRLASPVKHRAVAPFLRHADEKRIHTPRSDSKQSRQDRAFAFGDSSTVGTPVVMTVAPRTDEASRRVPFLTARILRCSLSSHYGVVCFGAHEGENVVRLATNSRMYVPHANPRIATTRVGSAKTWRSSKRLVCVRFRTARAATPENVLPWSAPRKIQCALALSVFSVRVTGVSRSAKELNTRRANDLPPEIEAQTQKSVRALR